MATKKSKKINNYLWLIALICVIVFLLLILIIRKQRNVIQYPSYEKNTSISQTVAPTSGSISYNSKFLKISFITPQYYTIEESGNDIDLKNNIGEISIVRIGTNNKTIEGYLYGLSDFNKLQITNSQKIRFNDMDAISCIIKFPVSGNQDRKAYYFYPAPWTIYSISTNKLELYDDIDQIARSFRYEP